MERKTKTYGKSDASEGSRTQGPTSGFELGLFSERVTLVVGDESVRAFARRARIDEKSLRKYMAGDTEPSAGAIVGIAHAGRVNLEWLATGQGPMKVLGAGEEAAGYKRVAPLDQDVMRDVIQVVEEFLQERGLVLEPVKKAELLVLLYEDVREHEGKVDRARIIRLVKLAA